MPAEILSPEVVGAAGAAVSAAIGGLFAHSKGKQKKLDKAHADQVDDLKKQLAEKNLTIAEKNQRISELELVLSQRDEKLRERAQDIDYYRKMLDEARDYQINEAKERLKEQKADTERVIKAIEAATMSNDRVVEAVRSFHADLRDDQMRRSR